MSLFTQPQHDDATYLARLAECSMGTLMPVLGQTIRGGVYDSLIVSASVSRVQLKDVVILGHVTVSGLGVSGTIYLPSVEGSEQAPVELGPNPLVIQRKTPFILARMAGLADDEGDTNTK